VISGTASIVSKTMVLTAFHVIAKTPLKPTRALLTGDWVIMETCERVRNVVNPTGDVIPVRVFKTSPTSDWALLQRNDGKEFDAELILPICPLASLPGNGSEQTLKIYHCPLDLFNCGRVDAVAPVSEDKRFGFRTTHKVFVQGGLFGGSSGGIYAIKSNVVETNGKVLAMHTESVSTAALVEEAQSLNPGASLYDILSEVSDSHAECHASFVQGLIICTYKPLMTLIEADL